MFGFLSTNKRSASPVRAGFRPQLEVLERRDVPSTVPLMAPPVQEAPQALVKVANVTPLQTEPTFVLSNNKVIANQVQLSNPDLKQQLDQAMLQRQTSINLQNNTNDNNRVSSSGTTNRAEANNLFVNKGIASTFAVEKDTAGRDKVAHFFLAAWGMGTTAGAGRRPFSTGISMRGRPWSECSATPARHGM